LLRGFSLRNGLSVTLEAFHKAILINTLTGYSHTFLQLDLKTTALLFE